MLRARAGAVGFLALVLVATAAARWRLLPIVLERDEGEFAYMGQLLLEGVPPYKEAANLKWPGVYAAYAAGMALFGQTTEGVHLTLMVVNLASIVLMFLLAYQIAGPYAAGIASGAFAVLAVSPQFLGFSAHATHFVVLAALAGLYVLIRTLDRGGSAGLAHAGFWFGVAGLMKQPGLAFAGLAAVLVLESGLRRRPPRMGTLIGDLALFSVGVACPILLTFVALYLAGVWDSFWMWTVEYARHYGTSASTSDIVKQFLLSARAVLIDNNQTLIVLAAFGATSPWWSPRLRDRKVLVVGFVVFSFLAVAPGFIFRNHYFVLMIPALALLSGMAVSAFAHDFPWIRSPRNREDVGLIVGVVCLLWPAYRCSQAILDVTPEQLSRAYFQGNPFASAPLVGDYLRERTSPNERIAILGSEPEILFYARRRSATPFLYTYPLMELHPLASRMHDMMISDIESAAPKFIVLAQVPFSWNERPGSVQTIQRWSKTYLEDHYQLVAAVVIAPGEEQRLIVADDETSVKRELDAAIARVKENRTPLAGQPLGGENKTVPTLLIFERKQVDKTRRPPSE